MYHLCSWINKCFQRFVFHMFLGNECECVVMFPIVMSLSKNHNFPMLCPLLPPPQPFPWLVNLLASKFALAMGLHLCLHLFVNLVNLHHNVKTLRHLFVDLLNLRWNVKTSLYLFVNLANLHQNVKTLLHLPMDLHASFHQNEKPLLLHLIMKPICELHIALLYHSCFGNASLTLLIKVCESGNL